VSTLQYVLEEGPRNDWFSSPMITGLSALAAVSLTAFIIRELTAVAPVVDLRLFRDPTFASGTFIAGVMFAMLMGSLFLLPVFTQEMMHFSATQSGIVLLPRTLAMMVAAPIVGRLYNKISPAWLVGFGILSVALGCWMQADIQLGTSIGDLFWPLAVTGIGFAFLFVPITTAALSNIPRHELAGAAGVNSFVRQIGGSIGLSIFATLFTRFSSHASAGLSSSVTVLRPEVAAQLAMQKAQLVAHGMTSDFAGAVARKAFAGRVALQGTVLGFEKTFVLQTIAFLVVLPLLFFLRVRREPKAKPHVDLAME